MEFSFVDFLPGIDLGPFYVGEKSQGGWQEELDGLSICLVRPRLKILLVRNVWRKDNCVMEGKMLGKSMAPCPASIL